MRLEYGLLAGQCQDMARRVAREEHFLPVAFQHRRYLIADPLNFLESPLLVLTGEEYARLTFEQLHDRLCDALRGNRAPVVAEVLLPDGTHQIIRGRKTK